MIPKVGTGFRKRSCAKRNAHERGPLDRRHRPAGADRGAAAVGLRGRAPRRNRRLFRSIAASEAGHLERPRAAAASSGGKRRRVPRRLSGNRLCELCRLAPVGAPPAAVCDCFGAAAIAAVDGAFLLGVMGPHTANAGRIYFPGADARSGRHFRRPSRSRFQRAARAQGGDRVRHHRISPPKPGWTTVFDLARWIAPYPKVLRSGPKRR